MRRVVAACRRRCAGCRADEPPPTDSTAGRRALAATCGLHAPLRGRPAPVRTMEAIACARSCASGTSRLGGRQRHRRRARRGSRAGRRGALRGSNAACGGWEVELYRGGAAPSLEPVEQLEIGSVRAFWALPLPRGDRSCASIRIVDCFERCRRLLAENILLSALFVNYGSSERR